MARESSLIFMALASLAILGSFVVPGPASELLFAFLAVIFPLALLILGATRHGRLGAVVWPASLLAVILVGSLAGLLVLHQSGAADPFVFGLPLALWIQLLGFFVLPLLVASMGYARTFDHWGLREDELQSLRRRFGSPSRDERKDRS